MEDGPLIRLEGLRRHYQVGGETVRALDGVDLAVARGDSLAVMGRRLPGLLRRRAGRPRR